MSSPIVDKRYKNNDIDLIKYHLINILLFLILFAPMVLQTLKASILILLVFIVFIELLKKNIVPMHPNIIIWITIYVFFQSFFLINGTYNNIDTFLQLAPVNILWPIVYTVTFVMVITGINNINFKKIFLFSLFMIELYILYLYLNYINILPNTFILSLPLQFEVNYNFGYLNFFTPSITSLFFLLPFAIAILINGKLYPDLNTKVIFFLVIIGIGLMFVIGRRTLIAIVLLAPVITILLNYFNLELRKSNKIKFFYVFIVMFIVLLMYIFIPIFLNLDLRIENFNTDLITSGTDKRYNQLYALVEGWKNNPLFGAGLGVNASISASNSVPGAYELTYIAQLFQTGIIGLIIYFSLISWIFCNFIKYIKINKADALLLIPILTGVISMFIANATNPYINSFDGLWVLFFPIALINRKLLNSKERL